MPILGAILVFWAVPEALKLVGWTKHDVGLGCGLAVTPLTAIRFEPRNATLNSEAIYLLAFLILVGITLTRAKSAVVKAIGVCLWVGTPLLCLIYVAYTFPGPHGISLNRLILLVLAPQWAGDIAAIFVGSWLKGPLLAPSISPKKTVSGAIGNLLACIGTAYLIGNALAVPTPASIGVGLCQGILGQAGDLFESHLKRQSNVKDSGTLLPGHGGVLDRIDSMLFSAIPSCLILASFMAPR